MRLKKITIFGFKSFADKISIDFDCEILGVVGPNGCGKSNVVDAFRWVMGEAHAKSFRADKMQDVLFAGNEKRKPANFAEVTIALSEVAGELNLPYDEIAITRKLYRNNESEYFINKEQVRLKDIQDLFLGSGIGKNSFAVFEQGKLDAVIHLHPLQRRAIFDEAAGTSRFLQRKKETLKRLSLATENYQRIKDIHLEVEKKTKTLKKQAAQAQFFQENKEALKDLEKNVLVTKWRLIEEKKQNFSLKESTLKQSFDEKKANCQELEQELEKQKQELAETEAQVKVFQKIQYEKKALLEIGKAALKEKKQHISDGERREKFLIKDKEELLKKRQTELEKGSEKQKTLAFLLEKNGALEQECLRKREIKADVEKETFSLRDHLRKLSSAYLKAMEEEKKLQSELQMKKFQSELQKERIEKISKSREEKKGKIALFEEQVLLKKGEVQALSKEIDELKNDLQAQEKELKARHAQNEKEKEEKGKLRSKIDSLAAKEDALLKLKEQFEGFSTGAKQLLLEANNPKSSLYKKIAPLFEHFGVKKEEEKPSASLFMYADTLVVENQSDLKEVFDFAQKKKLSNFSIFAKSHLKAKTNIRDHFLADIAVSDEILEASEQKEMVSSDGRFYATKRGVIFSIDGRKDLFQREVELKNLSDEKEKLKKEWELLEVKVKENSEKYLENETLIRTLSLQHRKKEMSLVQENFALQRALSDLSQIKNEMAELEKERQKLEEKADATDFTQQEEALKEKQKETASLLNLTGENEISLKALENRLKDVGIEFEKTQKELHQITSERQKVENEITFLAAREKQIQDEFAKKEKELEHLLTKVMQSKEFLETKVSEMEKEEKEAREAQNLEQAWGQKYLEAKQLGEKIHKKLSVLVSEIKEIEKELYKIEILNGEEKGKQQGLEEELKVHHNLAEENLSSVEVILDCSLDEAHRKIQELRRTIEKVDGVNLAAIEEYKVEEERFQFLSSQLNDLQTAKVDLEEIITKLDSESKKVFKKTYERIRVNFQKNFAILFNGGEADLKFTDSADILEAGIEIIAKPPGKQMRSITLLSGGEKCLTALALLFSIFEEKPAPFCILDEVDAPLDDSNVDRFSKIIQQYTDKTQFILVTHNKKTMAHADLLVGISMEEKGVSKLISLAFEKKNEESVV